MEIPTRFGKILSYAVWSPYIQGVNGYLQTGYRNSNVSAACATSYIASGMHTANIQSCPTRNPGSSHGENSSLELWFLCPPLDTVDGHTTVIKNVSDEFYRMALPVRLGAP